MVTLESKNKSGLTLPGPRGLFPSLYFHEQPPRTPERRRKAPEQRRGTRERPRRLKKDREKESRLNLSTRMSGLEKPLKDNRDLDGARKQSRNNGDRSNLEYRKEDILEVAKRIVCRYYALMLLFRTVLFPLLTFMIAWMADSKNSTISEKAKALQEAIDAAEQIFEGQIPPPLDSPGTSAIKMEDSSHSDTFSEDSTEDSSEDSS